MTSPSRPDSAASCGVQRDERSGDTTTSIRGMVMRRAICVSMAYQQSTDRAGTITAFTIRESRAASTSARSLTGMSVKSGRLRTGAPD
ncbi:MAG: hypothetical protein O3C62_01500 [Actinomycetota bacterium]|nr:hypothetical protein [Actinomycetota bacterium]MDA2970634.1 hypothetical protein [Actinomycetota bacterium]MDA3000338.1 hypothetical protein [Actinomycetota bacterium]